MKTPKRSSNLLKCLRISTLIFSILHLLEDPSSPLLSIMSLMNPDLNLSLTKTLISLYLIVGLSKFASPVGGDAAGTALISSRDWINLSRDAIGYILFSLLFEKLFYEYDISTVSLEKKNLIFVN